MENRNILNPTIKAQSVRNFIIRVISTFALILILGSFVMYFLIFKPLNEALEDSLTENFNQISLVNLNSFESDLKRGIEGAKSISSRTVIRDELDSYLKGQVSLGDLVDFTQPKFSDGARPLYALILAERVIDDGIIASFSNETNSEITLRPQDIPEESFEPTIKVNVIGNKAYSVVLSPVILDNKILCYDRLVFDLTQMIRSLNSTTVETYLMDDIDFSTLVNGATVAYTNGTTTIYNNNEYHFATADIGENAYFVSKQKSATLFAPLSHIKSKVFITGLFSILVFLLIVYLIVVRFASKELMNLERRQFVLEKVANEANIDPLTKAGSRNKGTNNLEQAFKDYISSGVSPAVMLFDIDNFKSINDMYGHYAGDIVLIEVINAVTEVIRRDDRLFRWGGDEFVGIFSGINENNAESIAAKIGDAVYNLQIDVGSAIILPTISIGVSFFNYDDVDFSNALKRADQAMYISKSEGRNKVSIM